MRIIHYLKIAVRQFARHKLYPVVDILALAIGFASFILSGYWSYWEHSFDNFHPDASSIYQISRKGGEVDVKGTPVTRTTFSTEQIDQLTAVLPEATQICAVQVGLSTVAKVEEQEFEVMALMADSSFFTFFQPSFVSGGYRNVPYDKSTVILTESLAKKLLSTTDCVGEQVNISGTKRVAGVIADFPANSKFNVDYILLDKLGDAYSYWRDLHIRIPKELKKQVQAKLDTLQLRDRWSEKFTHPATYKLKTMQEVHWENDFRQERFRMINTLHIAGWLMLIVALLNHLILFFSLQQTRLKQNITYTSFGATTRNLLARYITAFLLPLAVGYFLSLVIIEILFPYYQSFTSFEERSVISMSQLYQYSFVSVLCIVLVFIGMALLLLRFFIGKSTTRTQTTSLNVVLLRRTLIFVQVFIGVLFSLFSLTLYRQQIFTNQFDIGINTDHVVELNLGYRNAKRYDLIQLKNKVASNPHVVGTTLSVGPVLVSSGSDPSVVSSDVYLVNREKNYRYNASYGFAIVAPDFFTFWGMSLIEGEWPREGSSNLLINEALLSQCGKEGLDASFASAATGESEKISGVIKNYHFAPITDPIQPLVYSAQESVKKLLGYDYRYLYVRTSPGHEKEIEDYLRSTLMSEAQSAGLFTDQITVQTVENVLREHYKTERLILYLFGGVSLFSLLITLFAIYLLVNLSIEQRRKDIAIRKINGAEFKDILALFVREYLGLVLLANALAIPIGYLFMQQWLQYFTYHIQPNVFFFVLVMLVSVAIVYLSVAAQIRKSVSNDLVNQIKSE